MTDNVPLGSTRTVIAKWYFNEFWHCKRLPNDEVCFEYVRALMNLAGADGVLADDERAWILGSNAAKGVSEKILDYIRTYQPSPRDLELVITQKQVFTQNASRPLLFEAFLAASADNELHELEKEAIYRIGRAMGLDDVVLKQIEDLAVHERVHRQRVVDLTFPEGMEKACIAAESDC
eukprot:TRINITY_DN2358_c0_g2_i12.p1 TRINITY_DN2358_c0_g2~~TRINITY_DN2358_c0_g2_i12.p1  ORF type:complete len:178 (-),score=20.89 TRINITY_DN2358_c0_g2_i12:260-793(-)